MFEGKTRLIIGICVKIYSVLISAHIYFIAIPTTADNTTFIIIDPNSVVSKTPNVLVITLSIAKNNYFIKITRI